MIRHKDFFVILIRLFLGYIFLSAGLCKLTHGHFGQIIGPPFLEAQLAKYGLGLFAKVVATLQVICGMLLLSQRFSTIGAIMLVPMNLSILAVTISQNWTGTPYVNAFFTALNVLLLIYDWHKLKVLLNPRLASSVKAPVLDEYNYTIFNIAGMVLIMAAMATARFDITLTTAFAILAFSCFGFAIVQVKAITKLQAVIIGLVILNMLIITLAGRLVPFAQKLVLYNTLLILVLISVSFIKKLNPVGNLAT